MAKEKIQMVAPAEMGPKHPDHQEIYTNTARIGVSPWDIRIMFGHVIEPIPNKPQVGQDLVTIVMSPQLAKILMGQWAKSIASYEAAYGEIPDLTSILQAAAANKEGEGH
jgi:hypothetical protein